MRGEHTIAKWYTTTRVLLQRWVTVESQSTPAWLSRTGVRAALGPQRTSYISLPMELVNFINQPYGEM